MFTISSNSSKNYLARIVKITNLRKHSNADRLMCTTIDGNNVITGTDVREGDIMVYFPLECTINKEYLAWSDSFRDKTLNCDQEKAGFFEKEGRVKAIRLRGEKSEGYIVPLHDLLGWLAIFEEPVGVEGTEFDTINDIQICKKYIPPTPGSLTSSKDKKLVKRISRLVEGQFRLHEDTEQLRKNIARISPNDMISITYKLHGTSFVVGKVLTKRKLTWLERITRKVGVRVQEHVYDYVYASRRVVKNQYETRNANDYYGYDMWAEIKDKLMKKDSILDGVTLYGEAVGFTKEGGYIQGGYDYGAYPKEFNLYIYRITFTNSSGKVIDLTWGGVKDYCDKFGLNHTPELFYGKAKDHGMIDENHHWHENFLQNLEYLYTEKDCWMCANKVPGEGVVVRKDKTFDFEAYKLKSFRFLEQESKNLDKGVVDMETAEAENEEVSV